MNEDMRNDALGTLFRSADLDAPLPTYSTGLSQRVRLLARRRRRRRQLVTGSALAVALIACAALLPRDPPNRATAPQLARTNSGTPLPAFSTAELARSKAEAETRLAIARALMARERRGRERRRLEAALAAASWDANGPLESVRAEAALTLVAHGEELTSRTSNPADALAAYRRAAELFPDTPSAAVARRRIDELKSKVRLPEIPS